MTPRLPATPSILAMLALAACAHAHGADRLPTPEPARPRYEITITKEPGREVVYRQIAEPAFFESIEDRKADPSRSTRLPDASLEGSDGRPWPFRVEAWQLELSQARGRADGSSTVWIRVGYENFAGFLETVNGLKFPRAVGTASELRFTLMPGESARKEVDLDLRQVGSPAEERVTFHPAHPYEVQVKRLM